MPWYHLIPFLCLWERAPWVFLLTRLWNQALQKDVAETAISGTPTSKYDICPKPNPMVGTRLDNGITWGEDDFFAGWGETLGKGTYGEVVKAKDKRTRRTNRACVCQKIWKCHCEAKVMYGSCDVVTGRCEPLRSSTRKRCLIQKGGPTSRWKWKVKKGATSWGFWCCGMKPWFEKLKLKLGQISGT